MDELSTCRIFVVEFDLDAVLRTRSQIRLRHQCGRDLKEIDISYCIVILFSTWFFFILVVSFSSFSHNLYCSVLFECIMLCYCYGSVSDRFGPSAFNKFYLDLDLDILLRLRC